MRKFWKGKFSKKLNVSAATGQMAADLGERFALSNEKIEAWQKAREVSIDLYIAPYILTPIYSIHRQRKETRTTTARYVTRNQKEKRSRTSFPGKLINDHTHAHTQTCTHTQTHAQNES